MNIKSIAVAHKDFTDSEHINSAAEQQPQIQIQKQMLSIVIFHWIKII